VIGPCWEPLYLASIVRDFVIFILSGEANGPAL
jgi:hypothetical protein